MQSILMLSIEPLRDMAIRRCSKQNHCINKDILFYEIAYEHGPQRLLASLVAIEVTNTKMEIGVVGDRYS